MQYKTTVLPQWQKKYQHSLPYHCVSRLFVGVANKEVTKEHCQCKGEEVDGKIILVQSTGKVVRCNGEGFVRGLTVVIVKIINLGYISVDLQIQYC